STAFRYKTREMDAQSAGRELGVKAVVSGRVVQRGEVLMVSAELVNVMDGTQLWGQRFNRKLADVMAIEEEISHEISEKLRLKLGGEEQKRRARRNTEEAEAPQFYRRGRYHGNRRTDSAFQKGISCFGQAIQRDPGYGLAYAGLADCYNILGDY